MHPTADSLLVMYIESRGAAGDAGRWAAFIQESRTNVRKLIPLLLGIVATPLAWLAGALLSGGGHNLAGMMALFPWSMLLTGASSWVVSMLATAIQYPVYGLLLGYAHSRGKLAPVLLALSAVHDLAVIICFAIDPKSDWKVFI